jgi:hypothetical protein
MEVPEHLTALIKSMYANQETAARTEYGNTEWFEVRKDVSTRVHPVPLLIQHVQ